jgi:glycerol-1-phosphate dehydrogenase [NAD(P)+]
MEEITLPRKIIIKENTLSDIERLVEEFNNFKSILLILGLKTREIFGKKIFDLLVEKGYLINCIYVEKSDHSTLERVKKHAKILNVDLIMGIGGGKNIDIAKAVSHFLDIPYISIPTILSHDGIASDRCVISKGKKKYPILASPPLGVVIDLKIISQAPYRFFSAGCGDVIAKKTAVLDWKLANEEKNEDYNELAASLAYFSAALIIRNARYHKNNFKSSIRILAENLVNCGMAMSMTRSSRPCSGSEHMFCHSIDYLFPENRALHGEKVALGTYIMSFLHGIDYMEIKDALVAYNLPINYQQINIPQEILVKALSIAHKIRSDRRYTILRNGIKRNDAEKILKKLGVI